MGTAIILPNTVQGDQTVVGNQNVGGNNATTGYDVAQAFKYGTVPNGANGFALKASPNAYYGAQIAYSDTVGNTAFTTFLNVNRFTRTVNAATGAVNRDYDANGVINVTYNGTCNLSLASLNGASVFSGNLGLQCIVVATTASTALQLTAAATDQIMVVGSGLSNVGGNITMAAAVFGSATMTAVAPNLWIAHVVGNWTKN